MHCMDEQAKVRNITHLYGHHRCCYCNLPDTQIVLQGMLLVPITGYL